MIEHTTPNRPEMTTPIPTTRSSDANRGEVQRMAAYAAASAANAPNATISRLSHDVPSPMTARNA